MSMYVSPMSLLDRGDGPAQAVIDRNARSLAQRVADDTKQELEKVLGRVDNVIGSYEMSADPYGSSNLEYVNDLNELAEILKDQVKKRKYQQQVTIFVVGFQDVCGQRLNLLKQVNEFFMENSKSFEEEDWFSKTPDLDLDDVQDSIEDSLDLAHSLTRRLGELNREIVDYLAQYAEKKASSKGKKKLEKALQQTKDEIFSLQEKLMNLQSDVEEKDEKMQALFKQLESKNFEIQRFRTAAEVAKKNLQDVDALKAQIAKRDEQIHQMRQQISRLEIELTSSIHSKDRSNSRLMHESEETQHRLAELEKEVEEKKMAVETARRDMEKLLEGQVKSIMETHKKEIEELKEQHREELKKLQEELEETKHELIVEKHKAAQLGLEKASSSSESDVVRILDFDSEPNSQDQTRESSRQESRSSSKSGQSSGKGSSPKEKTKVKSAGKQSVSIEDTKEYAEIAVQDEDGDHKKAVVDEREIRKGRRSKSTLETVEELDVLDYDLDDEASWSSLPKDEIPNQFSQYRKQAVKKIHELEEQMKLMQAKTQRKVQTLKSQFQDHKNKWEAERKILIKQISQALKMQSDAEKEADTAMTQLEDFINDQEKLDEEEERIRKDFPIDIDSEKESTQGQEVEGTEPDLKKLMQQTDDAKVQELSSRGVTGALSAPPAIEEDTADGEKSLSEQGDLVSDKCRRSADSRASLRSQYKAKLEESKSVVEDRRLKSPAISLPSQMLIDDELVLDEDDDDHVTVTFKGVTDAGTSPPSVSALQKHRITPLLDHPVVSDFVKVYDDVVQFKDKLSKALLDKDLMTPSQILSEIETLQFDRNLKVFPQIEEMMYNVKYILEEVTSVLNSVIINDREPAVSSLMNVSRDPTKATLIPETSSASTREVLPTRDSVQTEMSTASDHRSLLSESKRLLHDLQEKYQMLRQQFEEEHKKHEEQLHHNTVVMMEMQDTINDLQRELSALGSKRRVRSGTPSQRVKKPPSPETSVMFTRLDSERNAKIMKRAVMDSRLPPETYKTAVSKMDQYVNIPAQRFGHLVKKYIHHCRMKTIEDNVRKSRSLDEDVFQVLDKMEALQNERARKWAEHMDEMGAERLRLANLLMDTLDTIEEESGLFLIKPMYSYRGRQVPDRYVGKLSRPVRPTHRPASHRSGGPLPPAPTPSQHKSSKPEIQSQQSVQESVVVIKKPQGPLEGDPAGVAGSSVPSVGQSSNQMWNCSASQSKTVKDDGPAGFNTPRILELDINRMLIGQNNVSSVLQQPLSSDRLVNVTQNNLRSYVTVSRPMVQLSSTDRPPSAKSSKSVPPSTPQSQGQAAAVMEKVQISETDKDVPLTLQYPRSPPLPPIVPTQAGSEAAAVSSTEPPQSPPGSSVFMSPQTKEVSDSGIEGSSKLLTRESSHLSSTSISALSEN